MVWSTSPNARSHFADVDLTTDALCHWRIAVALKGDGGEKMNVRRDLLSRSQGMLAQ